MMIVLFFVFFFKVIFLWLFLKDTLFQQQEVTVQMCSSFKELYCNHFRPPYSFHVNGRLFLIITFHKERYQ